MVKEYCSQNIIKCLLLYYIYFSTSVQQTFGDSPWCINHEKFHQGRLPLCHQGKAGRKLFTVSSLVELRTQKSVPKLKLCRPPKCQLLIFWYMKKIIRHENTPFEFSFTSLIPIWKRKGSALDLNMMRYIHTQIWEAKLCKALVTEHITEKIVAACPNILSTQEGCQDHPVLTTW